MYHSFIQKATVNSPIAPPPTLGSSTIRLCRSSMKGGGAYTVCYYGGGLFHTEYRQDTTYLCTVLEDTNERTKELKQTKWCCNAGHDVSDLLEMTRTYGRLPCLFTSGMVKPNESPRKDDDQLTIPENVVEYGGHSTYVSAPFTDSF